MRSRVTFSGFVALCAALGFLLGPNAATADIYKRIDKDGVIHFTNIKPRKHRKWKKIYDTGPGKASAVRGACTACDIVPSKDRSPERFRRYDQYIGRACELYQIPVPLVRAIIKVESDYDPRVVSSAGARGLMQLMPAVIKDMRVKDVHDPRDNIFGGVRFLRVLANRFQGDLPLTIAAYQAGPGNVLKYGDIPPFRNTQRYTRKVLKYYYRYKNQAR